MGAGNGVYMDPGVQRYSNQISARGCLAPREFSTVDKVLVVVMKANRLVVPGIRGSGSHRVHVAHRANIVNVADRATQPEARVVSYYQDSGNETSSVASTKATTVAHTAALRALAAPVPDTPVMTTGSFSRAASINPTATAARDFDGFARRRASQTPAQSSSAHDWNTAQLASGADAFSDDSTFASGAGPVTGQPSRTPLVRGAVTITAQPSRTPSVPAVINNTTPSADRPAPNTIWHWNYQDETAGPDIIPVKPVAADLDAMDVDDETPSPPANDGLWDRPAKKRVPRNSSARGLGHSRWA
jgi:hypothetical protein